MSGSRNGRPRVAWMLAAVVGVFAVQAAGATASSTVIVKNYGTQPAALSASAGAGRIVWLRRPRVGTPSVGRLAGGRPVVVPIARPQELRWLRVGPGVGGGPELMYARCVDSSCEVDRADLDGGNERRVVAGSRYAWVFGSSLLAPFGKGWGISTIGSGARPRPLLTPPKGRAWAFNGRAVAAVENDYDGDVSIFRLTLTSATVKRRVLLHRSFGLSNGFTISIVGLTTTHAYALDLDDQEFGNAGRLWEVGLDDGRVRTASLPAGTVAVTAPVGETAAVSRCTRNEDGDPTSCLLERRTLTWRGPPR